MTALAMKTCFLLSLVVASMAGSSSSSEGDTFVRSKKVAVMPPKPRLPPPPPSTQEAVEKFFMRPPPQEDMDAYDRHVKEEDVLRHIVQIEVIPDPPQPVEPEFGGPIYDQYSEKMQEEKEVDAEKELLLALNEVLLAQLDEQAEMAAKSKSDGKNNVNVVVSNNVRNYEVNDIKLNMNGQVGQEAGASVPGYYSGAKTIFLSVDLADGVLMVGLMLLLCYMVRKAFRYFGTRKPTTPMLPQVQTISVPSTFAVQTVGETPKKEFFA